MTAEPGAELAALRAVARDYLDGMVYADEARLRKAFHPRCSLVGHYHGELEYSTVDEFWGALKGAPSLTPGTTYYGEIVSIDVVGDVAVVKVEDDFWGDRFTDYLTMLKHDGRWSIISKAFYVHPKRG